MSEQKYEAPPGPPPGHSGAQTSSQARTTASSSQSGLTSPQNAFASNNPWRDAQSGTTKRQRPISGSVTPDFVPPPGPPPSHLHKEVDDVEMKDDDYQPPPGPPPGQRLSTASSSSTTTAAAAQYQPPSGPPPGWHARDTEPPPYDPWYGGPDEQLHPPPAFTAAHPDVKSPTANASYDDAASAHAWCAQNPLWRPPQHDAHTLDCIHDGELRLTEPPNSTNVTLYHPSGGRTYIRTNPHLRDTIFLSDKPIYAACSDSPLATGRPATVYFELHVTGLGDRYNEHNEVESGVALGFVAPPYPAWRLPGWHRGSLAVHGDDGRRYIDNSDGGLPFTAAFQKGDVVGLGMTFTAPAHGDAVAARCRVFFTRNGRPDGEWNLHEERDAGMQGGDVTGLEGEHDLLAAVGVFGGAELDVVFRREDWRYKP